MRDIFGVGHMRGGHNQNSQGPETRGANWRDKQNSRKRDGSLSSYQARKQRPKLGIAALAAEPSDEEDVADSKMRDELMQWLAAYSTHPASLPGKGGTPFVPISTSRDGKDPSHPRRLPQHQGGGRKRVTNAEQRRTPFLHRPKLPQKKKLK